MVALLRENRPVTPSSVDGRRKKNLIVGVTSAREKHEHDERGHSVFKKF
jgi:hypothetical protein